MSEEPRYVGLIATRGEERVTIRLSDGPEPQFCVWARGSLHNLTGASLKFVLWHCERKGWELESIDRRKIKDIMR